MTTKSVRNRKPGRPVGRPPAEFSEDLRRKILDVAEAMIEREGLEAFALRECARRAGISHGAPAHHFGDKTGLLKLLFHADTRKLLGVHIIGEGATELIHIGQAVLAFEGTVDYFVRTVFNYPTLAECYKTAAFDGINRLG